MTSLKCGSLSEMYIQNAQTDSTYITYKTTEQTIIHYIICFSFLFFKHMCVPWICIHPPEVLCYNLETKWIYGLIWNYILWIYTKYLYKIILKWGGIYSVKNECNSYACINIHILNSYVKRHWRVKYLVCQWRIMHRYHILSITEYIDLSLLL